MQAMVATGASSTFDRLSAPRPDATRRKPLSRFLTSKGSSSIYLHRPPIILEWGSMFLRIGYAEQCRPSHLLPVMLVSTTNNNNDTVDNSNQWNYSTKIIQKSAAQWYEILAPIIYKAYYDKLMETDPSNRRVVCCCVGLFREATWEEALLQILWNIGVPAVTFVSGLQMVPLALGCKRGIAVSIGHDESHCLAHVDGHPLEDTYQAVPCGSATLTPIVSDDESHLWWLDSRHPHSLTLALLKCLEACPKDALKDVVSNIAFFGEGVVVFPDLGRRVVVALHDAIVKGNANHELELPESISLDNLTLTPSNMTALRPIADRLAATSIAPYRPDLISWIGTSVWTTLHYRQSDADPSASLSKWILKPAP